MSFQIKECGNLCARLDVSRTRAERGCGERSEDGAMVCIEHHERVVIRGAVIRRVERGDLDRVALTAGGERLEIRLEHGTKRRVPGGAEIGDRLGWCGAEACRGQGESFLKRRCRRAKRHGVRDCALRSRLHDYTRVPPGNRNVQPVTARPRRRCNSFAIFQQRSPQRNSRQLRTLSRPVN